MNLKSIKLKLFLLMLLGILIPILILMTSYYSSTKTMSSDSQERVSTEVFKEVKNRVMYPAQSLISSMEARYQSLAVTMKKDEMIRLIHAELGNAKYGENGYFFVYDMQGTRLVAPENRSQEGKNLWDMTDAKGNKPVQMFIATSKAGGGFVRYIWLNPKTQKQEEKISYVAPLHLGSETFAVGTGTYLPMIEAARQAVGNSIERTRRQGFVGMMLTSLIILVIAIITVYFFANRSIAEPIGQVVGVVQKMADGNFTDSVDIKSNDEIGLMGLELNKMSQTLSAMIGKVLATAEHVNDGSHQIVIGNQDLSKRTQEQASTLEEIASTMEEITASIRQTAANSGEAAKISRLTLEAVQEGERGAAETADAMQRITESSKEIGEIIKVVNDIAFQTNLLALNAAVEAARAGEQGRGFAVVAAEVRSLAGRTAESSKEIERLIKESVERVENGNHLVQRSREMLQQIVQNTKDATQLVGDIASAMREQSTGSAQIQNAIEEMNMATQQNAALVQEVSASSEALSHEAGDLTNMMEGFKMKDKMHKERKLNVTGERKQIAPKPKAFDKVSSANKFHDDDFEQF